MTLFVKSFVPTCITRSSGFSFNYWSRFSTIVLLVPHWNVSNCNYVRLAESFFWYAIRPFFLILCFDGLFVSSSSSTYVAYLFFVFQFYYCHYWVLGDLPCCWVWSFKVLIFFPPKKSIIATAFLKLIKFSKVPQQA